MSFKRKTLHPHISFSHVFVLALMVFYGALSSASNGSEHELWKVAKPIEELEQNGDSRANIFSFTTPNVANKYIGVGFFFYNDSGCVGTMLGFKRYDDVCLDASHKNKTFYISQANLYKILAASSASGSVSSVNCVWQWDEWDGNHVDGVTTCNSGTETCSDPGATQSLSPDAFFSC